MGLTLFRLKMLAIIFIFTTLGTFAQENTPSQSKVITDPAVSRRCKVLMKKRNERIEIKQKLYSLLERNKKAYKSAPLERKTWRKKLNRNYKDLKHRLDLTLDKIKYQEEQIIRKGCPGIPLYKPSLL